MPLQCRIVQKPEGPQAYLSGALDEHAAVDKIFADLTATSDRSLVIYMQGVIRANSIGIRNWIQAMTAFTRTRTVTVEGLSYPLAMQANNVANLMGGAAVGSCMAPYFCAMCEANRTVLVTRADVGDSPVPPVKTCSDCGSPMEFDEVDEYFWFLRRS